MDFEAIKLWLTQWTEKQAKNFRLKGIIGLVLGPIALAVALTLVYWLLRLFTHGESNTLGDATKCLWITLAILPCLFVANRFAPRRNLMEERMSEGPADSLGGHYAARREAVFQFFLWILFTGPRLFDWSLHSFREAKQVKQMDIHGCAAVLWMLMSRPRKVPFEDIQRELDWLNLETALVEMKQIPGILFLKAAPPGLSLTQDLRDLIRKDLVKGSS